jgi:nucleoside-diphosphate-sugar epimerase
MIRASDLSLAKDVLGFVPEYRMPDAIRDLVDWYRGRAAPESSARKEQP